MSLYDYPNMQVVGVEPPWVEGTGGGGGAPPPDPSEPPPPANPLDAMTKAELLAYATESGVPPPMNNDMTKEEIRAAIDAHEGR